MPIYAYKCSSCGMSKDILRKISDPALTLCPQCGQEALEKQVTAAGFQLKGSGWYVTDFREGGKASESGASQAKTDVASKDTPSTPAATPAPAPATPAASASTASSSGAST